MSVKVYDTDGKLIGIQDYESAKKYLYNNQAHWLSYNVIQLSVDRSKLENRSSISKSLRRRVIEEEKRICYICGKKIPRGQYPTIDHLVSVRVGGSNDRNNLKCCCCECNRDKGSMELLEYFNYINTNREIYDYITDYQLRVIKKTVEKIQKDFPIITGELLEDTFDLFVNNKKSLSINKNSSLSTISEEIYKLIKDLNSNNIIKLN